LLHFQNPSIMAKTHFQRNLDFGAVDFGAAGVKGRICD
jgi:hypothetical protein